MRKRCAVVALVAVIVMSSGLAQAGGRGRKSGPVKTPFGPAYDTRSPEWRSSGGNIFVYQQLMEQKMLRRQQQMLLKQQQLSEKAAKSKPGAKDGAGRGKAKAKLEGSTAEFPVLDDVKKKSKKRTSTPTSADEPARSTVKPGDVMDDPLKSPSTSPARKTSAPLAVPKGAGAP